MKKNIIVYIETTKGNPSNASLESLTQARYIAEERGEKVLAVFLAPTSEASSKLAISFGADEVFCFQEERQEAEILAEYLFQMKHTYEPSIILLAATEEGKDIGSFLAAKAKLPALTDVVQIKKEADELVFTLPMYSGNILKDVKVAKENTAIVLLRSGACKKEMLEGRVGSIHTETTLAVEAKAKIIETVQEISESINLEEAKIIVAGGRGMGSKENFDLVKKLAEVCGAVVGATRPATEENWVARSHQIGQSGKIVAPKLYIACGISGATQHVSGVLASDFIVAINKDEDASIFEVADVGIVGNAMDILPLMIQEVEKMQAEK